MRPEGEASESEAFSSPPPPLIVEPVTPVNSVTFLSEVEALSPVASKSEAQVEAWATMETFSGLQPDRYPTMRVIELVVSALALTCWTAMCVLDLSDFWPSTQLDSEDSVPSHVLSLGAWCVACVAFVIRQSCLCRQEGPPCTSPKEEASTVAGAGLHYELMVLLATQWSLLSGALAWLVFHAANQRREQVIAGLLAVLALLALLLCTVVYVLTEHRRKLRRSSKIATAPSQKDSMASSQDRRMPRSDDALEDDAGQEALELSSMSEEPEASRLSVTLRSSLRSSRRSSRGIEEDSMSLSGNFVGKLWSDGSSLPMPIVKQATVDSLDSVNKWMSDKSMKQVIFDEVPLRSSRGRWRFLCPSLAEAPHSPTASVSCSVASLRRLGSQKFVFESEEDAQICLAKDIISHSHHLQVQVGSVDRSLSPSGSMLSMGSQKSYLSVPDAQQEANRRESDSSAMSDVSESRSKLSAKSSSFGS